MTTAARPPSASAARELAVGGRRWPAGTPVRVGSDPTCEVVVDGPGVALRHLQLDATPNGWLLRAFPPAVVWHRGITVDHLVLSGPTNLRLGDPNGPELALALLAPDGARTGGATADSAAAPTRSVVRIGRDRSNDLGVDDLTVSRHHAEIRWDGHGWILIDFGSPSGTYVDGERRFGGELHFGQRITVGVTSYEVTREGLVPARLLPGSEPPALAARNLRVEVAGGHRLLDDVSFEVARGEMVAIVGPSGSGKTTLLRSLTGSRPPDVGLVMVRGIDLYQAADEAGRRIGYVPQDDILHLALGVRQSLLFGAELRFPPDTTDTERQERVDEVLAQLELTARAEVPIESVSGGQRKRVSIALELLTRPEVLLLDEPTSGLDPGFERTVMELLRSLATGGRTVVVVTHSLQSLDLCDRVVFLAPGGTIAFTGAAHEALAYFGRTDFVDVFRDLETRQPEEWVARRERSDPSEGRRTTTATHDAVYGTSAPPGQPWKRQVSILARRQIAILRADRQNAWFLVGGVAVPSVLILALMGSDTLKLGQHDPVVARNVLGAVVVAAVAIGAANSIREIVKEMPIYLRERSVGLLRSAYLTSKLLVIGVLTTVQAAILTLVATSRSGGPQHANLLVSPRLELITDVALTALAAVALGLLLSTLVSSSEKAMALVPVVFVVQWLFSGAALDLQAKPVMREVAMVTSANWGMAASASTVDEHHLSWTCSDPPHQPADNGDEEAVDPADPAATARADARAEAAKEQEQSRRDAAPACDARWRTGMGPWLASVIALLLLVVVPIALADRRLAQREPLASHRAWDWPVPDKRGKPRAF